MRKDMNLLAVSIPQKMSEKVWQAVKDGQYASMAEFVRDAIRTKLDGVKEATQ